MGAIQTAAELAASLQTAANKARHTRNHFYNRRIAHTAVDSSYIAGHYTIGIGGAYMDFVNGVWPQTRR